MSLYKYPDVPPKVFPDMLIASDRVRVAQLTKLIQCVRASDLAMIERIHEKGYPGIINYVHPETGETALGLAASLNNLATLKLLLKLGADVNVVSLDGRTAVMRAAEFGHVETMKILADVGADMTLTDALGQSVIFHAIDPGPRHLQCAQIALDHGADVNNVSAVGMPTFVVACDTAKYNEEFCMLLLERGADPASIEKISGRTALMAAAKAGSVSLVKALLEGGAQVNAEMDKSELTAVHEAGRGGHLNVLRILAAFGGDMNKQTNRSYTEALTAMHLAATNGTNPKCITFLSQRGCMAKTKNRDGNTATVLAKNLGFSECAKACKKAEKMDASNAKPQPWQLLLHDYVYLKGVELLEAFQKEDPEGKGAILTDRFFQILTDFKVPLPNREEDDPQIMKNFIEQHQFDNKPPTTDYYTFLQGKLYMNKKFHQLLYETKIKPEKFGKGSNKDMKPPFPICTKAIDTKELYVPEHIKFTDFLRFDENSPPLHPFADDSAWYRKLPEPNTIRMNYAIARNDLETIVRSMATKPGRVNMMDEVYKRPLSVAARRGDVSLVQRLIDAGAEVNTKDNFYWTPLHEACHAGKISIVRALLDAGAKKNVATMNGATPLYRAIESNSRDIVQMLVFTDHVNTRTFNRAERCPMEVAIQYADYDIFAILRKREDELPPVQEKKKEKAKKPKAGKESSASTPAPRYDYKELLPPTHIDKRPSILDHETILVPDLVEATEDIRYLPMQTWTLMKSIADLIRDRQRRRVEKGWQVDFEEDYLDPYHRNVQQRINDILEKDALVEAQALRQFKKPKV